ncbi:MAG: HepT-like ribonuclease domain-containing protein [Planctomycetota bacterium]
MKKDPRIYLAQILERIVRIQNFTCVDKQSFLADPLIQDAVIRNLEVIGEASRRVEVEYQAAHPEIPWREMSGLRNILIHDYESVSLEKIWQVVEKELPSVKSTLEKILPPLDQLEREINEEN